MEGTHLSSRSELLDLRVSAKLAAPLGPMLLYEMLRTQHRCGAYFKVVLMAADTVGEVPGCGALDGLQRLVHLEHFCDLGDAISCVSAPALKKIEPTQLVVVKTTKHRALSSSTVIGC